MQVFVDGNPKLTVDANRRDEMRNYMASVGLKPDEINQKVHELYITNTTKFFGGGMAAVRSRATHPHHASPGEAEK